MYDTVLMSVSQCGRDLIQQSAANLKRNRALIESIGQTADIQEGHHLIGVPILLSVIQDWNDIGVIQPRYDLYLAAEASDELFVFS